jgi:hypothetical protein
LAIFYHLDRSGQSLRPGLVLALTPVPDDLPAAATAMLAKWCPHGVSLFGHQVITKQLEREIEVERIRREYYPDRVTRYAIIFACEAPRDIDVLRWQFFPPNDNGQRGRIWKVEGAPVFRADMNLFKEHCGHNATAAHAYWSQQETKNPLIEHLLSPPVKVIEEVAGA